MRILFKYDKKGAFEMLGVIKSWVNIENITSSSMEDSWEFQFDTVKFYIMYDRNSEENKMIYPYIIESVKSNTDEAARTQKVTENLYIALNSKIDDIELEE